MAEPDITEDALLGGRIRIRQPKHGYRVNVDTLLLAAAVPHGGNGRLVELGCGVGAALIAVAHRVSKLHPWERFIGVERDARMASLAKDNVALNGLQASVEILEGDVLQLDDAVGLFDSVFFNPPYDYSGEGREPAPARRDAYVADAPIADWIKVWSNRMSSRAWLTMIQRPHRLPEIIGALEGRLGGVLITPIRPHANAAARRVIVQAQKGSRAPLAIWKGLDLHPDERSKNKYTPEADAILRGEATIGVGS
jgi:tRNA1(Val) A37 N6-methylase TrmN6